VDNSPESRSSAGAVEIHNLIKLSIHVVCCEYDQEIQSAQVSGERCLVSMVTVRWSEEPLVGPPTLPSSTVRAVVQVGGRLGVGRRRAVRETRERGSGRERGERR
jgi:hypothetical protein